MVCSPDQARLNGAKSSGPVTERGRAIASRNATKHGLLATKPPILASEDLETFQGLLQSLIDQYVPQTPIEHLLIQKIAMDWQRLHRLWGVEAAIGDLEMLKTMQQSKTPALPKSPVFSKSSLEDPQAVLELEKMMLQKLLATVEDPVLRCLPKRGLQKWCQTKDASFLVDLLREQVSRTLDQFPHEAIPNAEEMKRGLHSKHIWRDLYRWKILSTRENAESVFPDLVLEMQSVCAGRIAHLEATLADLRNIGEAVQAAAAAAQAVPQEIERLSRYESHIWRSLQDAMDRLEQMQQQRQHQGSMGSFG